jgi:hypothetical protein
MKVVTELDRDGQFVPRKSAIRRLFPRRDPWNFAVTTKTLV